LKTSTAIGYLDPILARQCAACIRIHRRYFTIHLRLPRHHHHTVHRFLPPLRSPPQFIDLNPYETPPTQCHSAYKLPLFLPYTIGQSQASLTWPHKASILSLIQTMRKSGFFPPYLKREKNFKASTPKTLCSFWREAVLAVRWAAERCLKPCPVPSLSNVPWNSSISPFTHVQVPLVKSCRVT